MILIINIICNGYVMKWLDGIFYIVARFRYPVSMPEDIANDLGFETTNFLNFQEVMQRLTDPEHPPLRLSRFMPREEAEEVFQRAMRKEVFSQNSLFSYHFKRGWVEFVLHFDDQSRLRRLYLRHKDLKSKHEIIL